MEERELEKIKRMSLRTLRSQLVDLLIILFLNTVLILVYRKKLLLRLVNIIKNTMSIKNLNK